jgi:hypothetical protein
MDWEQLIAQAGLVFLKEGVSFLFSNVKDKKGVKKGEKSPDNSRSSADLKAIETESKTLSSKLHWEKVGTLFWLGNDLMWIQDMMYRMALPNRVLQGVNHAN